MDATNGGPAAEAGRSPAVRASDRERDEVVQRVQQAFADGRLDDGEFDERMRAALTARTHADLDLLLADLPAKTAPPGPAPQPPDGGRGERGRAEGFGSARGRWRLERYTTVVYKGSGWLDLRAAELNGPVTTFLTVAYKSRVTILVPPSVRVEMTGFGVTQAGRGGPRLPATDRRTGYPRAWHRIQGHGGDHYPAAGTSCPAPVADRISRARDRPGGT